MGFMGAMKGYFGVTDGQSPIQFGKEVQALPEKDKLDYHAMLRAAGVECDAPVLKPVS